MAILLHRLWISHHECVPLFNRGNRRWAESTIPLSSIPPEERLSSPCARAGSPRTGRYSVPVSATTLPRLSKSTSRERPAGTGTMTVLPKTVIARSASEAVSLTSTASVARGA